MHLWLLRHGEALSPPGTPDRDRPLSPAGRLQARRVGNFITRGPHPTAVLTSPLKRAVQTAAVVAARSTSPTPQETELLLSGADPSHILHELNHHNESCMLLVGHEPLMSTLAGMLISGHASAVLRFSPGTLALVQYSGKARPNGGTLQVLIPPDRLGRSGTTRSEKRP